jgi:hypothetical protein
MIDFQLYWIMENWPRYATQKSITSIDALNIGLSVQKMTEK